MKDWFKKQYNDIKSITFKDLFIMVFLGCLLYSFSMFIMVTLKAPSITSDIILDGIIYINMVLLALLIILYIILFIYKVQVKYKTYEIKNNGVIDKNLEKLDVGTLIEILEEYNMESLVLLKDNHIVIIAKDSIKLTKG